jgi:hypothetical protein
MQFPPPSLFDDTEPKWAGEPTPSPAVARAEAAERAIHEPLINLKAICKLARKGIPDKLRADYWKTMIGYYPPTRESWPEIRLAKEKEYMELVRSVCSLNDDNTVTTVARDVHRVDVDIPRTLPTMHFFACDESVVVDGVPTTFSPTQESLRRILHTLARVNKGFGYVQGMNELVGHLLFAFAEGKAVNVTLQIEADVFFCFQAMLSILGDNFCRSLDFDRETGVMSTLRTYDKLFEYCDPELHDHITNSAMVKPEFYAFRWITLLLSQEFLVPEVLRIWDFLFSFGSKMSSALLYCAIAMLIHQREELLELDGMTMILPVLQQFPPIDIDEMLDVAQKLLDEYGLDIIRQVKLDVCDNGNDAPLSPKQPHVTSPVSRGAAITGKIGGFMSAMRAGAQGIFSKGLSSSAATAESED